MKIIFRADGNGDIGYGHISRLNAFANFIKNKYVFSFLIRNNTNKKIINQCFSIIEIPNKLNIQDELVWIRSKFNPKDHLIITDGYQFDSNYQKTIKKSGYKLICIDDMIENYMYADSVINHAIGVEKNNYIGEKYVNYYLGSEYALLRKSFIKKTKYIDIKFETAFVSFGGTNSCRITMSAVQSLLNLKKFNKIFVVAGKSFTNKKSINFLRENDKTELFLDIGEDLMSQLMRIADFAIVPSSTISYELASLRCSIASGYTTKNQFNLYEGLRKKNIIFELGNISNFKEEDFDFKLKYIFNSNTDIFRIKMKNQIKFFDGNQKKRLTYIIDNLINK